MPEPLKGIQIIVNPDVLAFYPVAVFVDKGLKLLFGVILNHVAKAVAFLAFNGRLALHVGLTD